jgi:hypothetical protein
LLNSSIHSKKFNQVSAWRFRLLPGTLRHAMTLLSVGDAQRIADMELGFHPDYAAQVEAEPTTPALQIARGAQLQAPAMQPR